MSFSRQTIAGKYDSKVDNPETMIASQKQPLLTFILFAYNQERFIRHAVQSALNQTYGPLEIILSDDCSSDRTFEIMQEEASRYRGPHNLVLNRNQTNHGIGRHVNRLMQLAHGEFIIAAAGDDISLPNRTERIYQTYKSSQYTSKSIFSNVRQIDETGNLCGTGFSETFHPSDFKPEMLAHKDYILIGASHAWSRDVFDFFGPLLTPLTCEDMVIPFRSSLLGSICYIDEPLVLRRHHGNNVWNYKDGDVVGWERFLTHEKQSIYKNWLKDLRKIKESMPERNTEIEDIQNIVLSRLVPVEEDIKLMTGSYAKQFLMIVRAIWRGQKLGALRHKFGVFVIPQLYRYYLKIRYRLAEHRGARA